MPNKNSPGKSKNLLHIPKELLWRYIFILLVKMFRSHFSCISACKSVSMKSVGNFVLKLIPYMYFWYYKLFICKVLLWTYRYWQYFVSIIWSITTVFVSKYGRFRVETSKIWQLPPKKASTYYICQKRNLG